MARKKIEFRPDPTGYDVAGKLHLTRQQRQSLLKWVLYSLVCVLGLVLQDSMLLTDTLEHITNGLQMDTIVQIEPYDLLISKNQQETLTSPQLKEYIDKQRRRGIANIKEFEIEYHKRIATSFAAFILTLIGTALSVKKVKGGMGLNLGIGIALSFGYIVFQTISSSFAVNGNMSPVIAVWIPNITFLIIGVYLYRKASK